MMRRRLMLIFALLVGSTTSLFAQTSGVIEYGVDFKDRIFDEYEIDSGLSKEAANYRKARNKRYAANAKRFLEPDRTLFKVKFNKKGAIKKRIPIMTTKNGADPSLLPYLYGFYFIDGFLYGGIFDMEGYYHKIRWQKDDYSFELKSEFKNILGYRCQKAVIHFNFNEKKKEEKQQLLVAWFTPEIPYGYGPYRFFGLPGFILEFQNEDRRISARKITFKENMKLNFPDEEHILTDKELEEIRGY